MGSALLVSMSKSQVCFSGITWVLFEELFLQQFEGNETPAPTVLMENGE